MKSAATAQRVPAAAQAAKGAGTRRPFFTAAQAKAEQPVQAKLRMGRSGDRFEREADRAADRVVAGDRVGAGLAAGLTPVAQRREAEGGELREEAVQARLATEKEEKEEKQAPSAAQAKAVEEEERSEVQAKEAEEEPGAQAKEEEEPEAQARAQDEEPEAQARQENQPETQPRKEEAERPEAQAKEETAEREEEEVAQARGQAGGMTEDLSRQIHARRGLGNALPAADRGRMAAAFDADFSGVRIHTDAAAALLARSLGAQAFTVGSDIYFGAGRFDPGSRSGDHLLAHELAHTVQQGAAPSAEGPADVIRLAPADGDESYQVRPEIVEAIRLARGEAGKVNARLSGGDGKRIGADRLREYFLTAFGGPVISEAVIDRVTMVEVTSDGKKTRKDALPSWCGIFTWWAMKKAGIPIPDWKLGAPALDVMKPRPQGDLPRKGDIAIDVVPNNHFAMVTGIESAKDAEGKPVKMTRIATINGNTAGEDNLGGQVQEKWDPLSRWDHFLDPVGKMTLPDAPMVTVSRELEADQPAAGDGSGAPSPAAGEEAAEAAAEIEADAASEAELVGLDEPVAPPEPVAFTEPLPEADLTLPPPGDTGPTEQLATVEKVEMGGSSNEATAAFIEASPSAMAVSQPNFGPTVDAKVKSEQTELAAAPPVLEAKTSGAADVPLGSPSDIPLPEAAIGHGVTDADPGAIAPASEGAAEPCRANAEREKELDKEGSGSFFDAFKSFLKSFMGGIRTRDDSIDTRAGPRQKVALAGEADASRMDAQRKDGTAALASRRDSQVEAFRNHPGQANIQPKKVDEARPAPVSAEPAAEIEKQDDQAVRNYAEAPLPNDVRAVADAKIQAKMAPGLAEAKAQTTDAAATRDTEKAGAIDSAQAEAARINADADAQQRGIVIDNRTRVAGLQKEGIGGAYEQVNSFTKEAACEQTANRKDIAAHVRTEEGKAKTKLDEGEKEAEAKKDAGEKEAAEKKKELDKEQEDDSWWDRVKDAVKKAVKAVTAAIDAVFTAVRSAVKTIIETAKNAAIGLINAARSWVVDKIDKFRDWAKSQVDKYLKDAFPGLARRINDGIDAVADTAIAGVNAVADAAVAAVTALADGLAAALDKVLAVYQTALKTAVRVVGAVMQGDFAEALRAAIEGACEIAGVDPKPIFDFIDRAGKAVTAILKDPVKFIKNLFGAVGDGVGNFLKNVKTHLVQGVIGWLTGALSEVNLTGPFEFSAKGILRIVLEILGLTYANIKRRVIKKVPAAEKVFDVVEKGFGFLRRLVTEGPSALWEEIKSEVSNIKETVMGAIRNWLIVTVIKEGIVWLLALTNPASAIVKAVKLLFDLVMFLVERFQQIKEFILSVYDAVAAVAAGNFSKVTAAVESSLARIIPVLISLFASIAGLGGISRQVKKVIESVSKPINKAINRVVEKIVAYAKKVVAKLKAGAKKAKEKAKETAGKIKEFLWPKKKFKVDGDAHTLYFEKRGSGRQAYIRSTPTALKDFIAAWEKNAGPSVPPRKAAHLAAAKATLVKITALAGDISALEKKKKPVPEDKHHTMLALQTEMCASLSSLLGSESDLADAVERYKLEGLAGTYGTVPKPKFDYLTGDHQPQAATFKLLQERGYFAGAEGAKLRHRAAGKHADNAYIVNLHEERHKEGRTYGHKGGQTKQAFEQKVTAMEKAETDPKAQRRKAVAFLKQELAEDVAEMRAVYRRKATDNVWRDLDAFVPGNAKAKEKLVTQIRGQVDRGQTTLAAQPMDELAG